MKIQGHRIELGELEAVLMQHESINNAVIKAFSKEGNEKYLVGYIQFKNQPVDDKQIIEFMESKLPCYMVPAIFVHLEKLPISSNGKVDRNALLAPEKRLEKATESIFNQEYVLKISEMVKKVLDIDYVDSKADLLAMGANSIDIV
ncbi:MAG: non-ribosomal peptide synthetase, partial [Pedobacter sp.]